VNKYVNINCLNVSGMHIDHCYPKHLLSAFDVDAYTVRVRKAIHNSCCTTTTVTWLWHLTCFSLHYKTYCYVIC